VFVCIQSNDQHSACLPFRTKKTPRSTQSSAVLHLTPSDGRQFRQAVNPRLTAVKRQWPSGPSNVIKKFQIRSRRPDLTKKGYRSMKSTRIHLSSTLLAVNARLLQSANPLHAQDFAPHCHPLESDHFALSNPASPLPLACAPLL